MGDSGSPGDSGMLQPLPVRAVFDGRWWQMQRGEHHHLQAQRWLWEGIVRTTHQLRLHGKVSAVPELARSKSPMAPFHSFAVVFTKTQSPTNPDSFTFFFSSSFFFTQPYFWPGPSIFPTFWWFPLSSRPLPNYQNGSGGRSSQGGLCCGFPAQDGASGQLLRPVLGRSPGSSHGHRDSFPARYPAQSGTGGSCRRLFGRRGSFDTHTSFSTVDSIPYHLLFCLFFFALFFFLRPPTFFFSRQLDNERCNNQGPAKFTFGSGGSSCLFTRGNGSTRCQRHPAV